MSTFRLASLDYLSLIPMDTSFTLNYGAAPSGPLFGFALDNLAATTASYTVATSAPWLTPAPGSASGTLPSGGDAELLFEATPAIQTLRGGVYTTSVSVTRTSNGDRIELPVTLTIVETQPRVQVLGIDGLPIPSGSNTSTLASGTRFPVVATGNSLTNSFTIRNDGQGLLLLTSPTITLQGDPAFSVALQPDRPSLQPAETSSFQIRYSPTDGNLRETLVTVRTSDVNQPSTTFTVRGGGAIPNLTLTGGGVTILNGDTTPAVIDLTDFGPIDRLLPHTTRRTFILRNNGIAALSLGPIITTPANSGFTASLTTTVLPPGQTTLIRLDYKPVQPQGLVPATISLTAAGDPSPILSFAVQANNVLRDASTIQATSPFSNAEAWLELGAPSSVLIDLGLGTRYYDAANNALASVLFPSPLTRAVGWYESENFDMPYAAIGETNVVRGTFDIFQTGPGATRSTTTLSRKLPNFRLRLMQRFVYNAMMEISPNDAGVDPGVFPASLEFAPSPDPERPSRYYVDLDPVDVPYLRGVARETEGVQRGFEAVAEVNDFATAGGGIEGALLLKSSSLSTFPDPGRVATPVKIYGDNPWDFTNNTVFINRFQIDRDPLVQGQIVGFTTNTLLEISRSSQGITVNSTRVPTSKMAVVAFDFLEGNAFDVGRPEAQLRVDPERLYKISALISANNQSNRSPQIRLRARSVKFQWNMKLELGGAKTIGSNEGLTIGAQILPGSGSQNPEVDFPTNGRWYHLFISSPLDPNIRPDIDGPLEAKFPILANEPGMGDPAANSFRNLRIGFDVIDSVSFGPGADTEVASGLTLRRVEIRSLPQPSVTQGDQ